MKGDRETKTQPGQRDNSHDGLDLFLRASGRSPRIVDVDLHGKVRGAATFGSIDEHRCDATPDKGNQRTPSKTGQSRSLGGAKKEDELF